MKNTKILASSVQTDPNRLFITDLELKNFRNKIDNSKLAESIEQVRTDIMLDMNTKIDTILNNKDAMYALKQLANALEDEAVVDALMSLISSKLDMTELNKHADSNIKHINSEDRNNLNKLIELIKNGYSDWNAEYGDINFIHNKPTSLPANGGNADTLANKDLSYIMKNKCAASTVIGTMKQFEEAEAEFGIDVLLQIIVDGLMKYYIESGGGNIHIKEGIYTLGENVHFDRRDIIVSIGGCGDATILDCKGHTIVMDNTVASKLHVMNGKVIIESDCRITDITFDNCDIRFKKSQYTRFANNNVYNSKITYNNIFSCIVTNNIAKNSGRISYIGGNSMVDNNIE